MSYAGYLSSMGTKFRHPEPYYLRILDDRIFHYIAIWWIFSHTLGIFEAKNFKSHWNINFDMKEIGILL